ncbi:ABC transporter substrate-binding protein [Fodinicurvata sp. EGI_FJ10296]|uniref:ABC transporter substrate-binding protein n=1 Tax=Fodinicurvata sp. EGI_FJ10296 TaxID=3231908 RepID=UPI0034548A4E
MIAISRSALVAGIGAALAAGPALAQDQLVISTWGFNGDILEEELYAPFEEEHDVEIVLETGNNADRLNRVRVREGVDLIYLADAFAQQAIDAGLFAEIDRSLIPNIDNIYEVGRAPHDEEYGPAYTIGRYGIIYDSEALDEPVTSWSGMWRDDLEGEVSIPNPVTTAGQLIILAAAERAGVDAFENPDAAFESLAELEPNVLTAYSRGSEMVNLFSQGEISVAAAQDFTLSSVVDAVPGAVWADLEEGSYANLNTINILEGSDNKELAHAFINFHLDQDVQKALAVRGVDAPINTNVELTEEEAAPWTYGQDVVDALRIPDYERLNEVADDWVDRWEDIFAS